MQDFILLMGVESKLRNHHPELRNVRPLFFLFCSSGREAADLLSRVRAINRCTTIGRRIHHGVCPRKTFIWQDCVMRRRSCWVIRIEASVNGGFHHCLRRGKTSQPTR